MATLKYLAHIDLNNNQLQNAAMQILSSDPSGFEGHLYYNSSSNVLKFHNGTEYVSLSSASGDITGVTAGTGLSGGGTSGGVTLNLDATHTAITSITNASLVVGRDAHNQIKFSTDDQIIFRVGNADGVTFKASGEIEATSLDISGDVDVDGTLETDALSINGTTVTSTAAELNILDGVTATASELNIMDGVTSTTAELNVLDGITAVVGELNALDLGSTAVGTAIASKAVILDSNKDYTGIRNFTITGELDAATLDISGDADIDGTLEADAITIGGTNLLSEGMEFTGATTFSGNPVFSGTPSVTGTLNVAANIVHTGDTNTLIGFTTDAIKMQTGGTARIDVSDSGVRFGGTGARITQVEDNDSLGTSDTKLATQGNVKAYVDARVGTNITSLGTIAQDTVTFSSSNSNDPLVVIKNTTNDTKGARLHFVKDKGAAGADNDIIGEIEFIADDTEQTQTSFSKIISQVGEADNTDEAGKLSLQVAASDGTTTGIVSGLVLTGHKTSNYVDVTLGSGSSSTVTIPGNLTVSGTTTTVNSTTVNLNDHNIVLDSGNSTSAVVNGAGITIEGGSGDDAKINYSTTGPKFELLLGSSYEDLQVDQLIAASLDISGNVDVDGTLEADAITVNGTSLADTIAGTTVTTATNANHVLITDNESTDENNQITFIEGAGGGGANRGLEADGDFTYNPSSGTVTATIFKGNIDAVDGDFDGTLETDALSIAGTTVTSTAAELNILDGVTATTSEINLIDGGTSRGTTAVANGDGFLHNDGGTMRMTNVSKLADLFAGTNISASSSVLSVADAADDTKGVVELATTAEALAGSDTARAVTPAGLAARSFKTTIGDGSDLDITVTHNLGTRDVIVQLYDSSSYETVYAQVVRTDANNVTIDTNVAATTNDITVLITKVD